MTESTTTTEAPHTARVEAEPDYEPAIGAMLSAPMTLVEACDWATGHMAWINGNREPDKAWPDERLDAEITKYDAVITRIINEPSASLADIKAKARLLACDFRPVFERAELHDGERALRIFLNEVATLMASPMPDLSPDPIFAVIEEAQRLDAEHDATFAGPNQCDLCEPPNLIARRDAACKAKWAFVRGTLLKTVPRTAEGCQALARFAHDFWTAQGCDWSDDAPLVLDLIARSPAASAPPDLAGGAEALSERDTDTLLDAYSEWLFLERRILCRERYPNDARPERFVPCTEGANAFFFRVYDDGRHAPPPPPSTRAALVLKAAGCDWRADPYGNRQRAEQAHRDSVQQKDA